MRQTRIASLLAALIGLGVAPSHLTAQASTSLPRGTRGIDLVVLIDQSGSMWGHAAVQFRRNDQHGHRIGAAQDILLRLAEHVEGTALAHRVAVIDFGDEAEVALPAYILQDDPSTPGRIRGQAAAMAAARIAARDLVNTNTPAALELARAEFAGMGPAGSERRRVVLVLTDGRANVPPATTDAMRERVRTQARALTADGVEVFVIGLNDASDYWNRGDGAFWAGVAGPSRARLAENAGRNFATVLQSMLDDWMGVVSIPVTDAYSTPPYLRRLVFNVTFAQPRSSLRVLDPSGAPLPITSGGGIRAPGTFAHVSVGDPQPGTYTIERDPTRTYTVYVQQYGPLVTRIEPIADVPVGLATAVVFEVRQGSGAPLVPARRWPIDASVRVQAPDGSSEVIPADFEGNGRFSATFSPLQEGEYRVRLAGLVTMPDSSTYDVFAANALSYDEVVHVTNARALRLELGGVSRRGTLTTMPGREHVLLSFGLFDPDGAPIADPTSEVDDPDGWLTLELVDAAGRSIAPPVALVQTGSSLEGSVPFPVDWRRLKRWLNGRELRFRVVEEPGHLPDSVFLHSVVLPLEVAGRRIGGGALTAGPLSVVYPLWLRLPALALVLFVLAALTLGVVRITLPSLVVWWGDTASGRRVTLRVYNALTDPTGVAAKKIALPRRRRTKLDRQLKVVLDTGEVVATMLRVERVPSLHNVGAIITYRWQRSDAKDQRMLLMGKKPKPLRGLDGGEYLMMLDYKD